jgi:hypothetical protein
MALIPTAKITAFIKTNAIVLYLGYGSYCAYSQMSACNHAYKFQYSGNDIERKLHLEAFEKLKGKS